MSEPIRLSDHFTYGRLLRFTLPSIVMMVFSSVYGVVDGLFVSNFAGKTPFAAVNLIMPFLMIISTVGFMFGTGGSALIAKTLGEGDRERADQIFSMLIYTTVALGAALTLFGELLLRPVAQWMGADGELLACCVRYGRICTLGVIPYSFQMEFQSLMPTAEKPHLGLAFTVAGGVTNMALDALFIGLLGWELTGAALASVAGMIVGGFGPLIYFFLPNTSLLRAGRPWFSGRALLRICTNGCSELMSNISMSLVSALYNAQLLKYAGEDGVAAYGVLMYVSMIFLAIFIGYAMGVAPVVGFHFGADNTNELRSLLRRSAVIILGCSGLMVLFALVMARPLSSVFTGYDETLYALTVRGFHIYAFSFLFSGVAIFGSSFFTALNNGPVSALISFLRTIVFQVAFVLLLPLVLGIDGIWYSMVAAELCAALLAVGCLAVNRNKYHYL